MARNPFSRLLDWKIRYILKWEVVSEEKTRMKDELETTPCCFNNLAASCFPLLL